MSHNHDIERYPSKLDPYLNIYIYINNNYYFLVIIYSFLKSQHILESSSSSIIVETLFLKLLFLISNLRGTGHPQFSLTAHFSDLKLWLLHTHKYFIYNLL